MFRAFATAIAAALLLAGPALAQQPDKQPSKKQAAQQQRMKSCNAEASEKDLQGRERQAFMSDCLKADSGKSGKMTAQQQRMKSCNAQASKKELKGDERKAFMSKCLKSKA